MSGEEIQLPFAGEASRLDVEAMFEKTTVGLETSVTERETTAIGPVTNVSPAKRVLIYRLGSLGDMLIALPALRLAARAFPQAERRMLTNFPINVKAPPAAAILENSGLVHGYFRYAAGTRSLWELVSLWWQLRRWKPEVLVYMRASKDTEATQRDATFFRLCGIKRQIGLPVTEDMLRNRWFEEEQVWEPEGSRLARNLLELGDAELDSPASWDLGLTPTEVITADTAIRAVLPNWEPSGSVWDWNTRRRESAIAVSVGTKVQAKDWGRENWRNLLASIAKEFPERVLLLSGAAEEIEASEFAAEGWRKNGGGPVVNLCGKLTPRETAAAFARAHLFVGHDSGPMHLAAAVQTPCVAIFAARNKPRVWFPNGRQHRVVYHKVECWGCGLETCIVEKKRCLTSITVDQVMAEVRAVLG
jgi:heptosyltransferase III